MGQAAPLIIIALYVAYLGLSFIAVRKYFRYSKNHAAVARLFGRSLVLALCWGFAGVGGQGFGLPAPPVVALFVQLLGGSRLWFNWAVMPLFWSWIFYFFVYLIALGFKKRSMATGTWD